MNVCPEGLAKHRLLCYTISAFAAEMGLARTCPAAEADVSPFHAGSQAGRSKRTSMESCPSGRRYSTRNAARSQILPGFESLTLRFIIAQGDAPPARKTKTVRPKGSHRFFAFISKHKIGTESTNQFPIFAIMHRVYRAKSRRTLFPNCTRALIFRTMRPAILLPCDVPLLSLLQPWPSSRHWPLTIRRHCESCTNCREV